MGKETKSPEGATVFRTINAQISLANFKRTYDNRSLREPDGRSQGGKQNAKRGGSCTAPASAENNALTQAFLAQTLAEACEANDAAKISVVAAGIGLESLFETNCSETPSGSQAFQVHQDAPAMAPI